MLKKRIAILILTLAYAILLGHNIIPHHHHDHDEHLSEHHGADHQHDSDADNDGVMELFAHCTHTADGFAFTSAHNFSTMFSKLQLTFVALLLNNFAFDEFLIPPLLHKPPAEHLIYISPHSHSSGLRAPPLSFL